MRIVDGVGGDICPVEVMRRYLLARVHTSQNLLCRLGGPVTYDWFNQLVRRVAGMIGMDKERYSSHCFRIGRCTDWVGEGFSVTQIQKKGRWKSLAFLRYVRPGDVRL